MPCCDSKNRCVASLRGSAGRGECAFLRSHAGLLWCSTGWSVAVLRDLVAEDTYPVIPSINRSLEESIDYLRELGALDECRAENCSFHSASDVGR